MCCHERELCGFVHGDDSISTGDSVQLMWVESRLKEGLNFERCADLDRHDLESIGDLEQPDRYLACADEHGRIRHLRCLLLWLRGADRHIKKFDCTNESGVREIHECRDLRVHSRPSRELSDGRGSDEGHEFAQIDDFPGRQD